MILIIGTGNEFCGDDAAGLLTARHLLARQQELPCTILEHNGDAASLMDAWKDADCVILIDAVRTEAPPGTIHRFDLSATPVPRDLFLTSTHAMGVAEAIELSRCLNQLPPHFILLGIEGKNFEIGSTCSTQVKGAVPSAAERVVAELSVLGLAQE